MYHHRQLGVMILVLIFLAAVLAAEFALTAYFLNEAIRGGVPR
jgi:hypothetical protein